MKKKKQGRYGKVIVALVVLLNAAFAAGTLYAFVKVGEEPVTLIAAWFTFTTGELWMLKDIKKSKGREDKNDKDKLETKTLE